MEVEWKVRTISNSLLDTFNFFDEGAYELVVYAVFDDQAGSADTCLARGDKAGKRSALFERISKCDDTISKTWAYR